MLCTLGYVPLVLSCLCVMETSIQAHVAPSPLARLCLSFLSHTMCADSEVTNTLKVPVARGKTVKQNYMLLRSFIIVNVAILPSLSKLKVNFNIKDRIKAVLLL